MQKNSILLTKDGYTKFKNEFDNLILERPKAVAELKKARELGDLSENGYYKATRAKLSSIDSRVLYLKRILQNAQIINNVRNDSVTIGCLVTLNSKFGNEKYRIVSKFEADPSGGKISNVSPLGQGLMGKKLNDNVIIYSPSGTISYKIVSIIA